MSSDYVHDDDALDWGAAATGADKAPYENPLINLERKDISCPSY